MMISVCSDKGCFAGACRYMLRSEKGHLLEVAFFYLPGKALFPLEVLNRFLNHKCSLPFADSRLTIIRLRI